VHYELNAYMTSPGEWRKFTLTFTDTSKTSSTKLRWKSCRLITPQFGTEMKLQFRRTIDQKATLFRPSGWEYRAIWFNRKKRRLRESSADVQV